MNEKWTVKDYGEPEYLDGAQAQYSIRTNADNWQPIGYAFKYQDAVKMAAAPDMYEALKEWLALDEMMKECGFCADEYIECDAHQNQLQRIIKMRNAALLKAEGREV